MTEVAREAPQKRPVVGVFDSGFGGLTVLRALLEHLPGCDFLYLGDTARLPYGSKSAETITRYTASAVQTLAERGAELVVIACNTASALALPSLLLKSPVPLVGVIEPGALAAAQAAGSRGQQGPVLVLATEATVASHAYAAACAGHGLRSLEKACPLLVPLVEEGWTTHDVTRQVAAIYLGEALQQLRSIGEHTVPAAILLGCTHYPLLREVLETTAAEIMPPAPFVDSAEATARHVQTMLQNTPPAASVDPALTFLATDSTQKFMRLGERFLGRTIPFVEKIDLDR